MTAVEFIQKVSELRDEVETVVREYAKAMDLPPYFGLAYVVEEITDLRKEMEEE